ncbi:4-formylbenzenesulfonate dehydrogenase TsaC1/TsaC2 [Pandoraea pneumonica]|jgi:NAD(P)-dependent dehydrogenase (short-subunit alcohol dehydrogenase family)|uniref:4-formylbenzenesulfonate dehydrogenase TsaC1/TsaC2 n=1 Tax=Pandoraea pneumonica TaxID=2508299 RepID=A0A5E4X5E9_9BURK|nr:SDR family oxidoreductase [Pandoraea pneumonica]VVE31365.1 4-formylbenzenesulfonate dehydrogenase TsaC1/TsaC2 [Pandoraea pneumonica]
MTPSPERAKRKSLDALRDSGHAVVVTGASGGIGLAVANRLFDDGWHVVATDLDLSRLRDVFGARASEPRMTLAALDVTDHVSVDALAASLRERGGVAGLVNVAGLLQDVMPMLEMDDAMQRRVWEVNYFGAQHCLRAFAPLMTQAGAGAVVNITSINELRPLPLHAYSPTKVALGALTQLAAGELGASGIRVNAVAPGFTLTPIFEDKLATGKRSATAIEAHSALGRLVGTDEIAAAVSFLMCDQSSAITGVSLPVDAGWLVSSHWMNFRELSRANAA